MSDHPVFEIAPIVVAAIIGAIILVTINPANTTDIKGTALSGALIGAGVQIGVRLIGVS